MRNVIHNINCFAAFILCLLAAVVAHGQTHITVLNANDSGPGSLRQAIISVVAPGTIDFTNTVFGSSPQTINLSTVGDGTFGPSALKVDKNITINGPAAPNLITIAVSSGAPGMRLFFVSPAGNLTLKNLILSSGVAAGRMGGSGAQRGGNGGGAAGLGGAILNQGTLAMDTTTLFGNYARGGTNSPTFGGGLGSGGGGGGLGSDGVVGGQANTGGNGGGPNGGAAGTLTGSGTAGGVGGGGGGGGSGFGPGQGSGPGGAGGFGGGGGGGGAYQAGGFPGGTGGAGGAGGFGGGGGASGGGTPDGAVGVAGFGGGNGGHGDNTGNLGGSGGGGGGLGGGLFNHGGVVTATNCIFSANTAVGGLGEASFTPSAAGKGLGGGIFNRNGSVTIANATFSVNTANEGGVAIYNLGDGAGQTGRVSVVSGTISGVTNSSINGGATSFVTPVEPPYLAFATKLADGKFQLGFTNNSGTSFSVLAATNPTLPSASWTVLGVATQAPSGLFQFTDTQAASFSQRLYRLRSP